jgi:hypothetical protein
MQNMQHQVSHVWLKGVRRSAVLLSGAGRVALALLCWRLSSFLGSAWSRGSTA